MTPDRNHHFRFMEYINLNDPAFRQAGQRILARERQLLVMIWPPHSAGYKNFVIVRTAAALWQLLSERTPGEEITFFNSFEIALEGIAAEALENKARAQLHAPQAPTNCWLVYFENPAIDWQWAENVGEVIELIADHKGERIAVLEEPDWMDETLTHKALCL